MATVNELKAHVDALTKTVENLRDVVSEQNKTVEKLRDAVSGQRDEVVLLKSNYSNLVTQMSERLEIIHNRFQGKPKANKN